MDKVIGVTELQRNFRAVIDEVTERRIPYVLTRGSRAEAVLVPFEEYTRLAAAQERDVVFEIDQVLNRMRRRTATVSETEVMADVARARTEARTGARRRE